MSVFLSFDPADHATGTTMASLGWTEYPGLNSSDVSVGAPNFRISDGAVINDFYGGTVVPPRLVYRLGTPIVRGECRMRQSRRVSILFSDDGRQHIQVRRSFINGDTYIFVINHLIDTTAQIAYRYYVMFNLDSPNGPTLPSEVDFIWVVNEDDQLEIYVQGKRVQIYSVNSGLLSSSIPIPAALIGSDGVGYDAQFDNTYAFPLTLRDNANLLYCTDVRPRRADSTRSFLRISGTCNKAGVAHVDVEVRNQDGGLLFDGTADVEDDDSWSIDSGTIAKSYEPASFVANVASASNVLTVTEVRFGSVKAGQTLAGGTGVAANVRILSQLSGTPGGNGTYQMSANATANAYDAVFQGISELKISAVNAEGSAEPRTVFYGVERTAKLLGPIRMGQNETVAQYYGGFWPFNDLAKAIQWRTTAGTVQPAKANPAIFNADTGFNFISGAEIDIAPNGSPRKFPTNPAQNITSQLPWYPEPGDYVMDMTEAPDVLWSFSGTAGVVTTDLNYFGPNLHRLRISARWIPTSSGAGWGITLTRNAAKPNNGLPTVPWELRMRRVGSTGAWTDAYVAWLRESGVSFHRWMNGQICNEPINMPRNAFTAATRATISDQGYHFQSNTLPEFAIEMIVELHNLTGKDLYYCFPRAADESFVRYYAAYVRDNLRPDLKFIYTMSNEVWNFQFRQIFNYADDGLRIGLGKGVAGVASLTNGSNVINITSALSRNVEVGQKVTGKGIPAGTTITGFGTGTGRAGTYTMSNAATLTRAGVDIIYDAPTVGGDEVVDLDAIPDWYNGIVLTDGQLVRSFNIYRAIGNFTSTVDPVQTAQNDKFEYMQSGLRAAFRSHAEHIIWANEIVIDEFGSQATHDARCQLVVEQHGTNFIVNIPTYLDWSDLLSRITAVSDASYFGNGGGTFQWMTASDAVRYATEHLTGEPRIQVWIEACYLAQEQALARKRNNVRRFTDMLEERGLDEGDIQYWSYEGGPEYSFAFANSQLALTGNGPIDQELLLQDIMTFHEDDHYDLVRDFYDEYLDIVGGRVAYFDSFYPHRDNSGTFFPVGGNGYLFWGISKDTADRADTSSKYRALRDISIAKAGGSVPAPAPSQRRRQPLLLS